MVLGYAVIATPSHAAPYPSEGLATKFIQPSGATLQLRVIGDEFHARTVKNDYTVIYSPTENAYFYAKEAPDGRTLMPSTVPADQPPPAGLPKNLLESREQVKAIRSQNIQTFAPERLARWSARVNSVRMARMVTPMLVSGAKTFAGLHPEIAVAAAPVKGEKLGLMILVQFPDDSQTPGADPVTFPVAAEKITRLANEKGYHDDGNTGSIRDYYYDQSLGALTHEQVVSQVITLSHPRNFYNFADYPTNTMLRGAGETGRLLINEAVKKLRTASFDFSKLAVDGNQHVLATSLLFAGPDSGVWAEGLWPHASQVVPIEVGKTGSPRQVVRYQCTNIETDQPVIGTITHELGHMVLQYPDLYDTDASDGPGLVKGDGSSAGLGNHCLMAAGNFCNGGKTPAPIDLFLKDFSGWAKITTIKATDSLEVDLPSIGNQGYRIFKPDSTSEYFLIENRGLGDKWAAHTPDNGVIIWHVDEDVSTGNDRQQMTHAEHYEISIAQADGQFELERKLDRDRGDDKDLFDNEGVFSDDTTPAAKWWDGTKSGIKIRVLKGPGSSVKVRFGP